MGGGSTLRNASCCCGQLRVKVEGDPVAIGMCHCFECQKRTGSPFGLQGRFREEQVSIEGEATRYQRTGDTGNSVELFFCPICGSTVYWKPAALQGFVSVAVGAFADPSFPAPQYSVYETRQHKWIQPTVDIEHYD